MCDISTSHPKTFQMLATAIFKKVSTHILCCLLCMHVCIVMYVVCVCVYVMYVVCVGVGICVCVVM